MSLCFGVIRNEGGESGSGDGGSDTSLILGLAIKLKGG